MAHFPTPVPGYTDCHGSAWYARFAHNAVQLYFCLRIKAWDVYEPHTTSRSQLFSSIICFHPVSFILSSILSLADTISFKNLEKTNVPV